MRRHSAFFLALLTSSIGCTSSLVAQQDDDHWLRSCENNYGDGNDETYCEVRHLGFKPTGPVLRFEPDANGGIEMTGWDRDSVAISVRIQAGARSKDDARAIAREIKAQVSGSTVRVDGPSGRNQHWGVILIAMVPRSTGIQAETTNGPLSVEGVTGAITLRATNGPVSLDGVGGDVRARVQNGPLSVRLTGTSWTGAGLDAESVNGPVDLAIPERFNAELEVGTLNGPTDFQIPITVTLKGRGSERIRTTLGKGGAPVRVVTTNGPLTVRRADAH